MSDVEVAPGFFASNGSLQIFRCRPDPRACIGGVPGGTCAAGREGLACGRCMEGFRIGGEGACVPCGQDGSSEAVFYCCLVLALLAVLATYSVVDRFSKSRPSHAFLLVGLMLSLTVTLVQQMSIIGRFNDVRWVEPMVTLLRATQFILFDADLLHVNCVVRTSPLWKYFMQISGIAVLMVVVFISHSLFRCLHCRLATSSHSRALAASVGTIFMVAYTSVVAAAVGPLQCVENPGGQWTAQAYPTVVCWETSDHATMVSVSALAVQAPIVFFALCVRAVLVLPRRMSEGNTAFLETYRFLFFRYRPQAYWYPLVSMLRGFLVALLPILPRTPLQIIAMELLLIASLAVVVGSRPWRLEYACILDCFFTLSILFVCAHPFMQRRSLPKSSQLSLSSV
ncbi:unnamed protein product [Prorocentrum cordatum]|uniref:Uncharacterized protein n=1 Tax=Prorocentrum cordatum TaxID=2364126 RepID=A0ABN9W508_9DINO|nr:unnamed protein product [Polarella glacialis]